MIISRVSTQAKKAGKMAFFGKWTGKTGKEDAGRTGEMFFGIIFFENYLTGFTASWNSRNHGIIMGF